MLETFLFFFRYIELRILIIVRWIKFLQKLRYICSNSAVRFFLSLAGLLDSTEFSKKLEEGANEFWRASAKLGKKLDDKSSDAPRTRTD